MTNQLETMEFTRQFTANQGTRSSNPIENVAVNTNGTNDSVNFAENSNDSTWRGRACYSVAVEMSAALSSPPGWPSAP